MDRRNRSNRCTVLRLNKKRASADTHNGHRLRLFALHRGFNLVAEIDTYPHSNGGRLPDVKTYGVTFLRGSERGKSVIFDLYPDSKLHPQTASRNNEDRQQLRRGSSACNHGCSGGTGHCISVFRQCLKRMPTHPSISCCGS